MKYLELNFLCQPAGEWQQDVLIAQLASIGFDTFESTSGGFKAFIPEPNFNPVELETLLLSQDPAFKVDYTTEAIDSQNWNALWESNFQPIFIKDKVCVRATFHARFPEYPIEILIDPKMAFGTGHHQTTSLVMEYLLDESLKGKKVLDMLAAYDAFQLQNRIKPDYSNVGGLQVYNPEIADYEDWYLETEDDYFDDVDDYCEQCERAEELTEFNQSLFEQIDWKKIERMTR